jgi:hypothetical protein
VSSRTLGDASASPIRVFTPGMSTATTGRLVPPFARNQAQSVRSASPVWMRLPVGALRSVLIGGPKYSYWNVEATPALEPLSATPLASPAM